MLETNNKFKSNDDKNIENNFTCTHPPNVKCINCTQKKVILKPQQYRTCDHLEFDSEKIVKEFLKSYSSKEKFGFLIGKYMDYERVPLGVKAKVSAIYEPSQDNFPDGFFVNELSPEIYYFLEKIGLEIVGMIYTNLNQNHHDKNNKNNSDKENNKNDNKENNKENKNNSDKGNNSDNGNPSEYDQFALSSLEISFIASFQQLFSDDDHSKFITAVVQRNADEITIEPFLVSHQGQQLITQNKIIPTLTSKFYNKNFKSFPIAYSALNEYNVVVERIDKFIPSEYFIVKPTQGYKENPLFRNHLNLEKVSRKRVAQYFGGDFVFEKFSNFSFLFRIFKESYGEGDFEIGCKGNGDCKGDDNFKINISDLDLLINSVKNNDELEFSKFQLTDGFRKIKNVLEKYSDVWSCQKCTFINKTNSSECEMCMLPRFD